MLLLKSRSFWSKAWLILLHHFSTKPHCPRMDTYYKEPSVNQGLLNECIWGSRRWQVSTQCLALHLSATRAGGKSFTRRKTSTNHATWKQVEREKKTNEVSSRMGSHCGFRRYEMALNWIFYRQWWVGTQEAGDGTSTQGQKAGLRAFLLEFSELLFIQASVPLPPLWWSLLWPRHVWSIMTSYVPSLLCSNTSNTDQIGLYLHGWLHWSRILLKAGIRL